MERNREERPLWQTENECLIVKLMGGASEFWRLECKETATGTAGTTGAESGAGTDKRSGKENVKAEGRLSVGAPEWEIDGRPIAAELESLKPQEGRRVLRNGVTEYRLGGKVAGFEGLYLEAVLRMSHASPVVRFRYELRSDRPARLTRAAGRDHLIYGRVGLNGMNDVRELRLSEFVETVHSFRLSEYTLEDRHFRSGGEAMGPILTAGGDGFRALLAYEHGSQSPDAFLRYRLEPDRSVALEAVKGNYLTGQSLEDGYRTVWLQAACLSGGADDLAAAYRRFALRDMSPYGESRKPYIFYNTWNYQERNRNWRGKPYLSEMNESRMLAEIDAAHEMGIEVFVIDTGWYGKTGDWTVSPERFPRGMEPVKERLDRYGMKLGLWFNPTVAAVSSDMLERHADCVTVWQGAPSRPRPVWETEESVSLCMVSRYSDAFADKLIRLARELGVVYFKWDAIDQYSCDAPGHDHGDEEHSERERADHYAFRQVLRMSEIVEKLGETCPDAIVDFDITEGHRAVGLAFLAAGKYFLINNGPYFHNYNVPIDMEKDNWNLFFHPGPARGWICRTPLDYDRWLPSVLLLTHYLPDDPADNQLMALASLMLGQNGVWGDLPAVSPEGKALFREALARYKLVRDDIAEAFPVRSGRIGGSPEIHEKINRSSGKGIVSLFSSEAIGCRYITAALPAEVLWKTEGVRVARGADGHAIIEAEFDGPGARIVLFGGPD